MHLQWLQTRNVRNLSHVELTPAPGINLLVGPNGSGKTALLEAIYFLSRARSFRTPRINDVVRYNETGLLVTARLQRDGHVGLISTGIERTQGKTSIQYNGNRVKRVSEQARNVPIVLTTPDSQELITGSPKTRRNWLDWAMFHVEPEYLHLWSDYHKVLRQRNALLKNGKRDLQLMSGWEHSLARDGEKINKLRSGFLDKIQSALIGSSFFQTYLIPQIDLKKGWPEGEGLAESLGRGRATDYQNGTTQYGPHRGDILFRERERELVSSYSRGQIKLCVIKLLLALTKVVQEKTEQTPVLLMDDFSAELDLDARNQLLSHLLTLETQVFLTSTEPDDRIDGMRDISLFHVEQGSITKQLSN